MQVAKHNMYITTSSSHSRNHRCAYRLCLRYLTCEKDPKPFEPVDSDEVVLSIAFYHPAKRVKTQVPLIKSLSCVCLPSPKEFLVLGCQPLTALKDAFYCLSDRACSLTNPSVPEFSSSAQTCSTGLSTTRATSSSRTCSTTTCVTPPMWIIASTRRLSTPD